MSNCHFPLKSSASWTSGRINGRCLIQLIFHSIHGDRFMRHVELQIGNVPHWIVSVNIHYLRFAEAVEINRWKSLLCHWKAYNANLFHAYRPFSPYTEYDSVSSYSLTKWRCSKLVLHWNYPTIGWCFKLVLSFFVFSQNKQTAKYHPSFDCSLISTFVWFLKGGISDLVHLNLFSNPRVCYVPLHFMWK